MDLSKELEQIKTSSLSTVLKAVEEEQEFLNQKIHILKVLEFAEETEKLMQNGSFEESKSLMITNVTQPNKTVFIHCFIDDKNDEISLDNWELSASIYHFLEGIKKSHYISENLVNHTITFELKSGIAEKLKDALLSSSFKKALTYSHLENDIPKDNHSIKSKNKI